MPNGDSHYEGGDVQPMFRASVALKKPSVAAGSDREGQIQRLFQLPPAAKARLRFSRLKMAMGYYGFKTFKVGLAQKMWQDGRVGKMIMDDYGSLW